MKVNKIFLSLAFIVIALMSFSIILYSCNKGSGGKSFTITGSVVNESNTPIVNATVKSGSASTITATDGSFTLSSVSSAQSTFQIQVDASGYFTQYKNLDNIDGSSLNAQIKLIQKNTLGTLNANAGGNVGATGLRVIAPANGFTTANGAAYTGTVNVSARYITKTNTNIAGTMPGGDFKATDANGNRGGMRTYGFVATQFTDAAGNTLTPNANVKVAVTLPTGVTNPTTQGGQGWAYSATTGKWNNPISISVTGSEFFMPCTTLYQNIDAFVPISTMQGQVVCSGGQPAAFVPITIYNQNDGYVTVTNANGQYRVSVEATNTFTITALGGTSAVTASAASSGGTVIAPILTVTNCTSNTGSGSSGSGQFSLGGSTYSGTCVSSPEQYCTSGGIDVLVGNASSTFIIYNMPIASSGSFSFTDAAQTLQTCSLYGLTSAINGTQYITRNGTLTKTGAKSFTFSCTAYDILSNTSYSVTGSGNY